MSKQRRRTEKKMVKIWLKLKDGDLKDRLIKATMHFLRRYVSKGGGRPKGVPNWMPAMRRFRKKRGWA